jgi:hypothetical protein
MKEVASLLSQVGVTGDPPEKKKSHQFLESFLWILFFLAISTRRLKLRYPLKFNWHGIAYADPTGAAGTRQILASHPSFFFLIKQQFPPLIHKRDQHTHAHTQIERERALTLEHREFEDLRAPSLGGRRRRRIRRALRPRHNLELAFPARLLRRRQRRRLSVKQLGPRPPRQARTVGGLAPDGHLPKPLVALEAHHHAALRRQWNPKASPPPRRRQQPPPALKLP